MLTSASPKLAYVPPGAIAAAVAWEAAAHDRRVRNVSHQLRHASRTYGTFALVIVLLSWMYLAATITLLAAEVNSVLAPRDPDTTATSRSKS